MASGNTLDAMFAGEQDPGPTSNPAVLGTRNQHPVLTFSDSVQQSAIFSRLLPRHYAGGGITFYVHWSAVATTGNIAWDIAIERIGDGQQDIDSDGFATAQAVAGAAVPATSGLVKITNVAVSSGDLDGIAVGEMFRLRIRRDPATSGDATGLAELLGIEMKET